LSRINPRINLWMQDLAKQHRRQGKKNLPRAHHRSGPRVMPLEHTLPIYRRQQPWCSATYQLQRMEQNKDPAHGHNASFMDDHISHNVVLTLWRWHYDRRRNLTQTSKEQATRRARSRAIELQRRIIAPRSTKSNNRAQTPRHMYYCHTYRRRWDFRLPIPLTKFVTSHKDELSNRLASPSSRIESQIDGTRFTANRNPSPSASRRV